MNSTLERPSEARCFRALGKIFDWCATVEKGYQPQLASDIRFLANTCSILIIFQLKKGDPAKEESSRRDFECVSVLLVGNVRDIIKIKEG